MQHPMTGGRALVAALAAHGVDTVFGIPGTHNLAVYAALDEFGIRHVSPRHEQGAGYAADGYARSTGRPGVVVTTTGPAILNAAAAAAQAYSDSVPVLFVSPGMPSRHPGRGNGLLHEIRNQSLAMEAILGESIRVSSVEEIPLATQQAFALMLDGRPRPVHLEVPLDLLDATVDAVAEAVVVPPAASALRAPRPEALAAAADALTAADRVVVVAGGGSAGAAPRLRALAERLDAAVVTTANGNGVVPADHPSFVGSGLQHRSVVELCESADVVLAVGTELAPSDWWIGLPDIASKTVRIDVDASAIATNVAPRWPVVADADLALEALLAVLAEVPAKDDVEWVAEWRGRFQTDAATEGAPWVDLVAAVAAVLPRDAVLAVDNAMAGYYGFLSNLPLHRPRAFLYPTGAGTLGYALPAGVGAKVADPDVPVVVVQGDGGLMFSVAELAMAAQLGIALPVLVVDNGGYGEIHNEMVDRAEPVHAVGLGHPDFAALAVSLGCHGVRADDPAAVADAVKQALDADRPTVIHVRETSRAADGLR